MAERPVFISDVSIKDFVKVKKVNFEWYPGFSIIQKQKSIKSLHESFLKEFPEKKILEVSSKSNEELGIALSAFNLKIKTKNGVDFSVETAFQASKVFEMGGPFIDLYSKTSKEAKKDPRIRNNGKLLYFQFFDRVFELEPKTLFYDWLYINALSLNKELSDQVMEYDSFTDIEFNPKKSINCQARSVALYISLFKKDLLEKTLSSVEEYMNVLGVKSKNAGIEENNKIRQSEQLNIFDDIIDN